MMNSHSVFKRDCILKCLTGVRGLDQITEGGVPRNRPTLLRGGPGTGKSLLAAEFLARGSRQFGEPGVLVTFDESSQDVIANCASLGFDLEDLITQKKLIIIDPSNLVETGDYGLEGLFIRLGLAIDEVGAKRIVLDSIESLFASPNNQSLMRPELRRLFTWLKEKGVTAMVTGERGKGGSTSQGLGAYISDCVISLDQRVTDQIATRRLRILKYRGSAHGANEYPFLIDEEGFVVLPITSVTLTHEAPTDSVSTGVAKLDIMLGGKGIIRGSAVMLSGGTGTGKSSLAAHFIDAACRRGERGIYFAFEESPAQIARNMTSIGIDLVKWEKRGLLTFHAARPASLGLETHVSVMVNLIERLRPQVVVLDPISSFGSAGSWIDTRGMLIRLIDFLKTEQITAVFTTLSDAGKNAEADSVGASSLVDAWVMVRNLEQNGEQTRGLTVLKARGAKHSNQIRELLITDKGVDLRDIYLGPNGILAGSARDAQENDDRAVAKALGDDVKHKKELLVRKRNAMRAQIAQLESEFASEAHDIGRSIVEESSRQKAARAGRAAQATKRSAMRPIDGVAQ